MAHPHLRHVRRLLVAALGLAGCSEERQPVLDEVAYDVAECPGAVTIMGADGRETGYVRCDDGAIDRVGPASCEPIVREPRCDPANPGEEATCTTDADCVERPHGVCGLHLGFWSPSCVCIYPCTTDADCASGQLCVCDPVYGQGSMCAPAGCTSGEACETRRCGVAGYYGGCDFVQATACRTDADTCGSTETCAPDEWGPVDCWPVGDTNSYSGVADRWHCDGPSLVCGRPLTLADGPRVAPDATRGDWRDALTPAAVPAPLRRRLAAHWAAVGAMEHASIGSFARATLQLLALGAPAELIADTQRAAADEVEHARLAYGLASAYAGEPVGPGPLRLDDLAVEADPVVIVRALVIEGCVGETLGVVEALAGAGARDATVAAVCRRIAADELRHAALAWRTLRWLLESRPALRGHAVEALRVGIALHAPGEARSGALADERGGTDGMGGIDGTPATHRVDGIGGMDGIDGMDGIGDSVDPDGMGGRGAIDPALAAVGIPAPEAARRLRRAAVAEVITPLAAALGLG